MEWRKSLIRPFKGCHRNTFPSRGSGIAVALKCRTALVLHRRQLAILWRGDHCRAPGPCLRWRGRTGREYFRRSRIATWTGIAPACAGVWLLQFQITLPLQREGRKRCRKINIRFWPYQFFICETIYGFECNASKRPSSPNPIPTISRAHTRRTMQQYR